MVVTVKADVTPYSHVEVDCSFSGFCCTLHSGGQRNHPDGGSKSLHCTRHYIMSQKTASCYLMNQRKVRSLSQQCVPYYFSRREVEQHNQCSDQAMDQMIWVLISGRDVEGFIFAKNIQAGALAPSALYAVAGGPFCIS